MGNGKTNKNYCVTLIPVIKQKSLKKMGNGKMNKNYCVTLIPVIKQKSLTLNMGISFFLFFF